MKSVGPYPLYEYGFSANLLKISRIMTKWVKDFAEGSWTPFTTESIRETLVIGGEEMEIRFVLMLVWSDEFAWAIKGQMGKDSSTGEDTIFIRLDLNTELYPQIMSEIVPQIKGVLSHEAEHIHQWLGRRGEEMLPPTSDSGWEKYHDRKAEDYLSDRREVQAYLAQSLRVAKTHKITMKAAMLRELDMVFPKNKRGAAKVLSIWIREGKKRYPQADWSDT